MTLMQFGLCSFELIKHWREKLVVDILRIMECFKPRKKHSGNDCSFCVYNVQSKGWKRCRSRYQLQTNKKQFSLTCFPYDNVTINQLLANICQNNLNTGSSQFYRSALTFSDYCTEAICFQLKLCIKFCCRGLSGQ